MNTAEQALQLGIGSITRAQHMRTMLLKDNNHRIFDFWRISAMFDRVLAGFSRISFRPFKDDHELNLRPT